MKDVAYFLISCSDGGAEALDPHHLDVYFDHFARSLARERPRVDSALVERAWRALYPIACADFYRFYAGWAPQYWERDKVGHTIVEEVLRGL